MEPDIQWEGLAIRFVIVIRQLIVGKKLECIGMDQNGLGLMEYGRHKYIGM